MMYNEPMVMVGQSKKAKINKMVISIKLKTKSEEKKINFDAIVTMPMYAWKIERASSVAIRFRIRIRIQLK